MTHDELLNKLSILCPSNCSIKNEHWHESIDGYTNKYLEILRAIVELHKPLYYRKGEIETKGAHCDECSKGSHGENAVEYPCPTIQAIEKELV